MRAIALAALAVALTAAPGFAQVDATKIGPNADRDFWCAAAFGMLSYSLKQTGDDSGADVANTNMQVIFAGLAGQMQGKGLKKEDFDTLVNNYTAATMDPFTQAAFTREQCDTAVTEAKAAVPAQAPTPSATATTTTAP